VASLTKTTASLPCRASEGNRAGEMKYRQTSKKANSPWEAYSRVCSGFYGCTMCVVFIFVDDSLVSNNRCSNGRDTKNQKGENNNKRDRDEAIDCASI